ncbi:hypothetical protein ACFL1R_10415 [Candidatus Latescibacterota bacterium]
MKKIELFIGCIAFLQTSLISLAVERPKTVNEQRAWEQNYDKIKIRKKNSSLTDQSERFLVIPNDYRYPYDFKMAETPPLIDFAVIQNLEPEYLPYHLAKNTGGAWGGWGDVTKGPDDCFYFSISNHLSYGAESYIIRYDPKSKRQTIVLSAKGTCGWQPGDFGDGKIHGDIDFGPDGDTWVLTYFGPVPKDEEWETVYKGSWLLRYNCFSGETKSFGIPLEGASWPYHNYDWERGILFGVDHSGYDVIVYDTKARKMIYGGTPPENICWYARCVMIDRDTGVIYTTDANSKDKQFVSYERRNNKFTRMKATVPLNPKTGKRGNFRAHTNSKDARGAYLCFDNFGTIFKFYPAEDRTEYITENWGKEGAYTANLCMSPGGRYLYYLPGLSGELPKGTPVVQYNTETGEKKVLAFIFDYYMEKYGYAPVRCYGIELDEKGESLVFYANGGFSGPDDDNPYGIKMRRPAVFQLHIPEGERVE